LKQFLEEPVEFGDLRLAPTVELAGLAELSTMSDNDEKLEVIKRIASNIKAEDDARDHVARLRSGQVAASELPRRA
jgi:hypothetical protein